MGLIKDFTLILVQEIRTMDSQFAVKDPEK